MPRSPARPLPARKSQDRKKPQDKQPSRQLLKALATNVKTAREERGLTQVQLALRSGLERTYISHIESFVARNPTLSTLERIARGLDVTEAYLLTRVRKAP